MSYLKTSIVILLTFSFGFVFASCDSFLEEQPKGSLSGEVVENEKGVETLLVGAYSALSPTDNTLGIAAGDAFMSGPAHWPYGAVASDVAQKGSEPTDQAEANDLMGHSWGATNTYFNGLWSNRYEGVARANGVLQTIDASAENIPENAATRMRAEARFLRAYFYFDLKKNFDNVPWIADTTEEFNQPNNVEEEVIWPKIEEDLEYAMNNLDDTAPDQGRANKWAAEAFLAKAHLYQEEWDDAKEHFDNVIANGQTPSGEPYALEEQYSHNFNAAEQDADNSEIIFSVEMTGEDGSGGIANSWSGYMLNYPMGGSFGCCGFFLGSHDLVNSYKTSVDGLPEPNDFTTAFNGMSDVLKHDQGISSSTQYTPATNASLDPRLDWTVGRRGVPFHDHGPHPGTAWIRSDSDYGGPYSSKKHIWRQSNSSVANNPNSWAPGTGVDYPAMRFADVLLMAAEAEIEVGDPDDALDYVNRVRSRAANSQGYVDNSMNEAYALAVVDNEADMLDTDPSQYDWVVRTDRNSTFMFLGGDDVEDLSNWNEYPNPADNYNIDTYTAAEFGTGGDAREKIHFERKLELALEGHRFYDLVRWDRADTRMSQYFDYQGALTNDVEGASFREGVFPIPQTQIDVSVVDGEAQLTQNPQY